MFNALYNTNHKPNIIFNVQAIINLASISVIIILILFLAIQY